MNGNAIHADADSPETERDKLCRRRPLQVRDMPAEWRWQTRTRTHTPTCRAARLRLVNQVGLVMWMSVGFCMGAARVTVKHSCSNALAPALRKPRLPVIFVMWSLTICGLPSSSSIHSTNRAGRVEEHLQPQAHLSRCCFYFSFYCLHCTIHSVPSFNLTNSYIFFGGEA